MLEQEFRFVSAARHDIQNAVREPCLFIEFCKPQARHRRCGRCLQNIGVAAGNGQRGHPAHRDHGREVPGGDAGVYAERLAVAHGVIAIGDVHLALAHHQRRDAAREFGHFQSLLHIARSFGPRLAVFPCDHHGQLVEVRHDQITEFEHQIRTAARRGLRPRRKRGCCRLYRCLYFLVRTDWRLRDDLAGAGVIDIGIFVGFRFHIVAVNKRTKLFYHCFSPFLCVMQSDFRYFTALSTAPLIKYLLRKI